MRVNGGKNMAEIKATRLQLKEMIEESIGKRLTDAVKDAKDRQTLGLYQMLAAERDYQDRNKAEKVDPIGGLMIALAQGKGDIDKSFSWGQRKFGDKSKITTALKAMQASTDTAGGFLIPDVLSTEIIELLIPTAIMRKIGATIMPLVNGQLSIPRITGGATAAYLYEGANIQTSQETLGQLNLVGRKLGCEVAISNDLLNFAVQNADQIVRQDMVTRMALREDLAFMEGDGEANTPVGLRNIMQSSNQIAMTATPTAITATLDAGRVQTLLDNANVPDTRRSWIMRPTTKNWLATVRTSTGALAFPEVQGANPVWWGYPVVTTTQMTIDSGTSNYIYLVEAPELIIGDAMTMRIDASSEAAYDLSGTLVSPFSRDETVIRAISMHDFGMRHVASAAALTGCTWGY
jgi:HK97 family phage major capsid protein